MPLLIKNPQRWGRTSAFAQGAVCCGGGGQLNPLKAQRPKKTILIIIKKKETILAAFPVLFSQPNALFCPFQTHSFFCRAGAEIPGWGGGGEEGTSGRTDGEDCDVPPLCGGTLPNAPLLRPGVGSELRPPPLGAAADGTFGAGALSAADPSAVRVGAAPAALNAEPTRGRGGGAGPLSPAPPHTHTPPKGTYALLKRDPLAHIHGPERSLRSPIQYCTERP